MCVPALTWRPRPHLAPAPALSRRPRPHLAPAPALTWRGPLSLGARARHRLAPAPALAPLGARARSRSARRPRPRSLRSARRPRSLRSAPAPARRSRPRLARRPRPRLFTGGLQQQSLSCRGIWSDSIFSWLSTKQTWFIQVAQPAKPAHRTRKPRRRLFTGGHQPQSLSRCGIGSDSVFSWLSTNQTWFIQVAQPAKPQERVN